MRDPAFQAELDRLLKEYVGRPSPLSTAPRLSELVGCAVYLKREDLNHTGAHKINNTLGQALLARRMGKRRIIAETGAGQHGVATATVCARFGLECIVYMGEEDMRRQELNVYRMRLMGAKVVPVLVRNSHAQGRDERGDPRLGHQRQRQLLHHRVGRRPRAVSANGSRFPGGHRARGAGADARDCGTRSRAASSRVSAAARTRWGFSTRSSTIAEVELVGVEAAGEGLDSGEHSASLQRGVPGVLHGSLSYLLAGRERPGPSGSLHLRRPRLSGRRTRALVSQGDRARALRLGHRRRSRGGTRDSEPPGGHHSRARDVTCRRLGRQRQGAVATSDDAVLICISGRGDKDLAQITEMGLLPT